MLWPYLYVLPALCAMGFAFAFPLVQVVRDSFYAGSFASPIWVGLDNYKGVIDDPEFRASLFNNIKLMLAVPVMLGLGLAIALVLNDRIRGGRQYQSVIFLPYVLPAVAIGIAFSFLLQQNGVLNTALRDAHLGFLAHDWLGNSHLAIVSVGGLVVWQQLGFGVVVFTAALLGATSIRPGRVNVWGTVLAVAVLAVTVAGLNQLGAPFFVEPLFNGSMLILAVGLAVQAAQRRQRRGTEADKAAAIGTGSSGAPVVE